MESQPIALFTFNFDIPITKREIDMKKLMINIAVAATMTMAVELPICETFNDEPKITCLSDDSSAVIVTRHEDGLSIEFFKNGKKVYVQFDDVGTGYIYYSGRHHKMDTSMPSMNKKEMDNYFKEIIEMVTEDLEG